MRGILPNVNFSALNSLSSFASIFVDSSMKDVGFRLLSDESGDWIVWFMPSIPIGEVVEVVPNKLV